ncbi:phosphatidylglycerophosphatase A [Roseomonas sp. CECT 9278]|uniref:phosphatidylglycerophosphatase A family protein n=1 Tax=Roseomonas sp. CECT 9278 TaxID=2845823 RepID=UPI001E4A6318|nr:phosphatidylglycerophosphatase A [Roseomonas sp. CECT 9278]CAH0265776.1 Phosphatidylglycerophosphatase A [Roseomonas sp. CECT 9278]
MTPARAIATLGGIGLLRPAPGTWGSLVVLPAVLLGPVACLVLAACVTVGGWIAVRAVLAEGGDQDPGWIVVDEAAGMLLALAALPAAGWIGVVAAFALFRAFDIVKPWPVSWADGLHGATGVMLDDVIAGAMAGAVLLLAGGLW